MTPHAIKNCDKLSRLEWLLKRLPPEAWAEYRRIAAPARAEYRRIEGEAWAEYERIEGEARAEYGRIEGEAWAEYERICLEKAKEIALKYTTTKESENAFHE